MTEEDKNRNLVLKLISLVVVHLGILCDAAHLALSHRCPFLVHSLDRVPDPARQVKTVSFTFHDAALMNVSNALLGRPRIQVLGKGEVFGHLGLLAQRAVGLAQEVVHIPFVRRQSSQRQKIFERSLANKRNENTQP